MADTVFHGTTLSRANSIRTDGFEIPAIETELRQLADQHEVDFCALKNLLKVEAFGLGCVPERENSVYFSASKEIAESYASRGPEYLYFGLSFIHRLQHPGFDEEFPKWWHSDDLMWRLFRSRLSDSPVVLTVSFPEGSFPKLFRNSLPPEEADSMAAIGIYGPVDIAIPLPVTDATVTLVEEVPVRISPDLARYVAGHSWPDYGDIDPFARERELDFAFNQPPFGVFEAVETLS